jgi:hypothetical protein
MGAVQRHGGLNHFREMMGYKKVKVNYWNDDIIINELKAICGVIDKIPTARDLIDMDRTDLLSAMSKRKGIQYYKNAIEEKRMTND